MFIIVGILDRSHQWQKEREIPLLGCVEGNRMWGRSEFSGENFQLKHLRFFNFPIFRTNPPSYFTQWQKEKGSGWVVKLHLDLDFDFVIISFLHPLPPLPTSSFPFTSTVYTLLSCCSCCILTTTNTIFYFDHHFIFYSTSFYIYFAVVVAAVGLFTLTNGSSFKMRENQWTA